MINVREIALDQNLRLVSDSFLHSILLLYFQHHTNIEFDEIMITYLHSLSQYTEYRPLMKERAFPIVMLLIDR